MSYEIIDEASLPSRIRPYGKTKWGDLFETLRMASRGKWVVVPFDDAMPIERMRQNICGTMRQSPGCFRIETRIDRMNKCLYVRRKDEAR